MRPVFCGNLEFDARQSDVERLFRRYGRVDRVDMKSGFAFVYMEDERDAEDAIRKLDRIEFGRKGRRLRIEWTKQERGGRRPDSSRRTSGNSKPSKTLFVINFDPINTRTRDLERHFEQYGKITNVRIRRNFAFVQFEVQEDATQALEATHMSKFMDRVISVEYAVRDEDDKRNGYSPDRRGGRDASPDRRRRSPSPYRRDRGSPDYGHGSVPRSDHRGSPEYPKADRRGSPDYAKSGRRGSPEYAKAGRRGSPEYAKADRRGSADYAKADRRASPDYDKADRRATPDYEKEDGRVSPDYDKADRRASPDYIKEDRKASPDYAKADRRASHDYDDKGESPANDRYHSRSPPSRERSRS